MKRPIQLGLTLLLITSNLVAQDTLRTDVVDVVKAFKPILSEALKIQSNPNPEIPETQKPVFTYNVPEKTPEGNLTVYTIKPLSLGTSLLPKLKTNYTKLGYGNYNTPLFETYWSTTRNKNLQAGVFFKHLSSNPSTDRTFSNNTAYAYGKRFLATGLLSADIYYYRNVVNLYGLKPDITTFTKDDIRQQWQLVDAKVAYQNILKDTSKLSYKLDGTLYFFNSAKVLNLNETDFKLNGNFNKRIGGNPLDVKTAVNITQLKNGASDYQRVFIDVNPRYRLNMDKLYINVGFNATLFNDSIGNELYFFPTVEAGYNLINNALTPFAGITGNLQRNTMRSIALENPFIRNFTLNNTVNRFEVYGGLKGVISPQTSFLLLASLANVQNMLFYVADSATLNSQQTIYDTQTSSVFNLKAELNHEFNNTFSFGYVLNYYGYSISLDAPFSRPTFTNTLNMGYNMSDKFLWKVQLFTMNARDGRILLSNNGFEEVNLKGLVDVNLGLDYRYSKHTSLFININNIANNQYQRWVSLPVYGINIIGGLAVTF